MFVSCSILASIGEGALVLAPHSHPPLVTDASLGLGAHVGLPLALLIDAAGGPVNVWDAFIAITQAFNNAALSGHYVQAASALINAPANITNAFLNGHDVLPVSAVLDGIPITLDFPLDGILVGPTPATLTLDGIVTLPNRRHADQWPDSRAVLRVPTARARNHAIVIVGHGA